MKILLIEDEHALAKGLRQALVHAHFVVNWIDKGKDALYVIATDSPDIVILDIGLPDMDGLQVLRKLRVNDKNLPVLLLTARDAIDDKVVGLDLGADDYLTKPFDIQELLARLRMLGRRSGVIASSKIIIGSICMDTASHQVTCDGELIELARREYMLLHILMENSGRVQTRDNLESKLYSWGEEVSSNSIQVHIHNLRKKLVSDFIMTIRGVGYIVKED